MKSPASLLFNEKETRAMVKTIAESLISDLKSKKIKDIAFIGIQAKGVPLAKRISERISESTGIEVPVGMLDISMYRDDIGKRKTLPHIHETDIPFDLDDKAIILFDDVLHTGRTIRAALDALTDYGRPKLIRLAVLIDRGSQEFPIMANYAGKTIEMDNKKDFIYIAWKETDNEDGVYLIKK
jgi:pyrimidine operon attenuation protein/uracil phosphoribosyltransferase